jgi:hypothetical protein
MLGGVFVSTFRPQRTSRTRPIADIAGLRQLWRVPSPSPVPKDWNPVIHILDELSEGRHSITELLYSADHYDGPAYVDAMLFLARLPLVEFTRSAPNSEALAYDAAAEVFQMAMSVPKEERGTFSEVNVDLNKEGEQVLALLKLGHP